LVRKREGLRPLGRPNRKCNNIKIDMKEKDWRCALDPSGSGWAPAAGFFKNGNEPQESPDDSLSGPKHAVNS
jgi:hypothetical protein